MNMHPFLLLAAALFTLTACDVEQPKRPPAVPDNNTGECSAGQTRKEGQCVPIQYNRTGADQGGTEQALISACQSSAEGSQWDATAKTCTCAGSATPSEDKKTCVPPSSVVNDDAKQGKCEAGGNTWKRETQECTCANPSHVVLNDGTCGPQSTSGTTTPPGSNSGNPSAGDTPSGAEKACKDSSGQWNATSKVCDCGQGRKLNAQEACESTAPAGDAQMAAGKWKALTDTFLISQDIATKKNCFLAKDKQIVISADSVSFPANPAQRIVTVSDAGDSGCAAGSWNVLKDAFEKMP